MPPRRSEKPQHRIHLILDEDEVQQIDDFSFEARIRTRSAAIRELIEMGLKQHRNQDREER